MLQAVARLLSLRPDPLTRNWEGESVHDLMVENAVHGIFDNLEPGPVLSWSDHDGITVDQLPAATPQRAVNA